MNGKKVIYQMKMNEQYVVNLDNFNFLKVNLIYVKSTVLSSKIQVSSDGLCNNKYIKKKKKKKDLTSFS